MPSMTVNKGIDLGTTNSAVAVLDGAQVNVIPNSLGNLITPSVVHLDSRGTCFVGQAAKDQARGDRERNTALRFKRTMGQGDQAAKLFKSSGKQLRPEEISAEILKELRRDYRDQRGEELRDVVITVPADFDQAALDATRGAARLAGFRSCTLLMEPIAAALAYGFASKAEDEFWLVYDFGGGTFDAAVINMEDGEPSVVTHAGDIWLGGSDIDADIVKQKFYPKLVEEFKVPRLDPNSDFWTVPYQRLLDEAEKAKIQVCRTRRRHSVLYEQLGNDEAGRPITLDVELTSEDVAEISRPYIAQTLDLCRRALAEKSIPAQRIAKVLMVGGSTLNPWVREAVQREFGRPLEFALNPMTVVAQGAAVFGGTVIVQPGEDDDAPPSGSFLLRIVTPLMGEDPRPPIAGRIEVADGEMPAGMTIEFVDPLSGWRSGKTTIAAGGNFRTSLRAEPQKAVQFKVELHAADGSALQIYPESFEYICKGTGHLSLTSMHAFGLGMADGRLDPILPKGATLPFISRPRIYRTVRALKRNSGDLLRIPLYEGGNVDRAARNREVVILPIPGDRISRDLPARAEVEITLSCDRKYKLKASALVTMLEQEFDVEVETVGAAPLIEKLREASHLQQRRWDELQGKAERHDDPKLRKIVEEILEQQFLRRISDLLDQTVDGESLKHADQLIRDFATKLDELSDAVEWPELVAESEQRLDDCRKALARCGTNAHRHELHRIEEQVRAAVSSGSSPNLRRRIAECVGLYVQITENDIKLWAARLGWCLEQKDSMTDQRKAELLIEQGVKAYERQDVDMLRASVRQLWGLMPEGTSPPQAEEEGISDIIGTQLRM